MLIFVICHTFVNVEIWCMNVCIASAQYFDDTFRKEAVNWLAMSYNFKFGRNKSKKNELLVSAII